MCKLVENVFMSRETSFILFFFFSGTGTTVGDFTEVSALGRFFSKYALHEIPIGSVKTNIGHLEPGAGVASLIKVY